MREERIPFRNIYCNQEKPPRWFDCVDRNGEMIFEHKQGNATDAMTAQQFVDSFNKLFGKKILELNI